MAQWTVEIWEDKVAQEKMGKLWSHDFQSWVYVLDEIMQTICMGTAQYISGNTVQ